MAIVCVNAQSGVEVGTEKNWAIMEKTNTPRIVFLSKLDKENINLEKTYESLKALDSKITPIVIPWGTFDKLKGVIDLIEMKAYEYTDDKGKAVKVQDIPADMKDEAQKLHDQMLESVVECDDDLMNKYFEGEDITADELKAALAKGIASD